MSAFAVLFCYPNLITIKVLQCLIVTVKHKFLLNQVMLLCPQYFKDCINLLVISRPRFRCFIQLLIHVLNLFALLRKNIPLTLSKCITINLKYSKFDKANKGAVDNFFFNRAKFSSCSSIHLNFPFKNSVVVVVMVLKFIIKLLTTIQMLVLQFKCH